MTQCQILSACMYTWRQSRNIDCSVQTPTRQPSNQRAPNAECKLRHWGAQPMLLCQPLAYLPPPGADTTCQSHGGLYLAMLPKCCPCRDHSKSLHSSWMTLSCSFIANFWMYRGYKEIERISRVISHQSVIFDIWCRHSPLPSPQLINNNAYDK